MPPAQTAASLRTRESHGQRCVVMDPTREPLPRPFLGKWCKRSGQFASAGLLTQRVRSGWTAPPVLSASVTAMATQMATRRRSAGSGGGCGAAFPLV